MLAYFEKFQLAMSPEEAQSASHQGRCDEDVAVLAKKLSPQRQAINPEDIRTELEEYGAWSAEELQDEDQNWERIVWIAAGQIREEICAI